jgi:hypothetical protein
LKENVLHELSELLTELNIDGVKRKVERAATPLRRKYHQCPEQGYAIGWPEIRGRECFLTDSVAGSHESGG